MTERIKEIENLIKEEFKKKEEALNNMSHFQSEVFAIDKIIADLNEEKDNIEKKIKDTKINTFNNFIKCWEKGLDYYKNDLVFFNDNLYLILENHRSEKTPEDDLINYLEIKRKGVDEDDDRTN